MRAGKGGVGAREAFEQLVPLYEERLFNFMLKRCRTRDEAEDLTQEAFVRAWERISSYDPAWRFSTWLFTIAMRQAVSRHRKTKRESRGEPPEQVAPRVADTSDERDLGVRLWALAQERKPYFWVGLKFFNVYGPNEYHKGRMASVILHAFNQINATGGMKLFRSHRPDYTDGGQLRDFVYVKDLCAVCLFFMEQRKHSGLYNLGSGTARTFLDLARSTFKAMERPENITFIDTPADIRDKYQYFTEARMEKMRSIGYDKPFHTLEEGVADYVRNYLVPGARM